ncbi:MAG: xylose isomerase [Bacteroidetes bacterium GWE2_41_25]|nr:MAG: xylose isomerase [Bacteroidetes bacterium GWA2_40_15]OFX91695.1 MAG: xylose isomerase [Bacteroidetes bacterium GWE2_41_25]OFX97612.1 MAG: xylose isomerase [Bacteroidetes bacterium GWC2_40_22]OFY56936.1 MAG: xylose isomerase [Bacteroidetes bacterium GWF2_41_9]HAM09522.1 xylose isomerase [Bacteroidales bacterium]
MATRKEFLSIIGIAGIGTMMSDKMNSPSAYPETKFRFCLNTSTVSKKPLDIIRYIDIATEAGYDGIEIWIRDLKQYLDSGKKAAELKKYLTDKNLTVENAIGFAPWLADRESGFRQMKEEMEMAAAIGGKRIAAPASGVKGDKPLDLFMAGDRYRELLQLGRETGVMPQFEFWGASDVLWHIGQALMIVAVAGDKDARILPDVYHMFRGGSSFDTLKMIDGSLIEIFHFNDYISSKPGKEQNDSDRVYPGDGAAPFKEIISRLKMMGGEKVLSLELFNETYWKEDPVSIAKTGLKKMKSVSIL